MYSTPNPVAAPASYDEAPASIGQSSQCRPPWPLDSTGDCAHPVPPSQDGLPWCGLVFTTRGHEATCPLTPVPPSPAVSHDPARETRYCPQPPADLLSLRAPRRCNRPATTYSPTSAAGRTASMCPTSSLHLTQQVQFDNIRAKVCCRQPTRDCNPRATPVHFVRKEMHDVSLGLERSPSWRPSTKKLWTE